MKDIFVSPHFDDVALSCGGQILADASREKDVLVVNMFTSEPLNPSKGTALTLFDSLNSARTLEDKAAWDAIGVSCVHANLPEALLRKTFPFRFFATSLDEDVVENIYTLLSALAHAHPQATLHCPAGIGNHVDHLACQRAAFRLLDEHRVDRILFYEDIPYSWLKFLREEYYRRFVEMVDLDPQGRAQAMRSGGESLWTYLSEKEVPFPRGKKLFPAVYTAQFLANVVKRGATRQRKYIGTVRTTNLNDDQMQRKKALIYHYMSQIPMLFGNAPDQLLSNARESFSKEVTIEIARRG